MANALLHGIYMVTTGALLLLWQMLFFMEYIWSLQELFCFYGKCSSSWNIYGHYRSSSAFMANALLHGIYMVTTGALLLLWQMLFFMEYIWSLQELFCFYGKCSSSWNIYGHYRSSSAFMANALLHGIYMVTTGALLLLWQMLYFMEYIWSLQELFCFYGKCSTSWNIYGHYRSSSAFMANALLHGIYMVTTGALLLLWQMLYFMEYIWSLQELSAFMANALLHEIYMVTYVQAFVFMDFFLLLL